MERPSPRARAGRECRWQFIRPGISTLPLAGIRRSARGAGGGAARTSAIRSSSTKTKASSRTRRLPSMVTTVAPSKAVLRVIRFLLPRRASPAGSLRLPGKDRVLRADAPWGQADLRWPTKGEVGPQPEVLGDSEMGPDGLGLARSEGAPVRAQAERVGGREHVLHARPAVQVPVVLGGGG